MRTKRERLQGAVEYMRRGVNDCARQLELAQQIVERRKIRLELAQFRLAELEQELAELEATDGSVAP